MLIVLGSTAVLGGASPGHSVFGEEMARSAASNGSCSPIETS